MPRKPLNHSEQFKENFELLPKQEILDFVHNKRARVSEDKKQNRRQGVEETSTQRPPENPETSSSSPHPFSCESIMSEVKKEDAQPIKTVRITADLPKPNHKRLKEAVYDMNTDINKLVNALVDQFLDAAGY